MGGKADFNMAGGVAIACESDYPKQCNVRYTVNPIKNNVEFCFAIHIPTWCREAEYSINGAPFDGEIKDGYLYIQRKWQNGDVIEINAKLPVLRIYSNLTVAGNAGLVCLQRGPIVYCLEEADNPAPLASLRLPPDAEITESEIDISTQKDVIMLTAKGIKETGDNTLYTEQKPKTEPATLQAIPYYTWSNRELGEMRVWIRE
jgi:hypothetical protein